MSLSSVLFLFLAHLGVGIAFTLVFVSREAGVKFFRFNTGLAAILLVIALAFRFQSRSGATLFADVAFVVCTGLSVFSWATVGRVFTTIRTAILSTAVISGVIAVVLQAVDLSAGRSPSLARLT